MGRIIKDPIYGYISLDRANCGNLIDSALFQRLQNIQQTSYVSLFPSANHNRFTHSLGVYFLGCIAFDSFKLNLEEYHADKFKLTKDDWDSLESSFLHACLLHDIGHSPFSHNGEAFYLKAMSHNPEQVQIWADLKEIVSQDDFTQDATINELAPIGKPHEIMSALLGIKYFREQIDKLDASFFARSIIGLKYNDNNKFNEVKNCLIELLNSTTIDIDKLDYLIRDCYMAGYSSMNLDYSRLLKSICIVEDGEKYTLAYCKGALSVLEQVVIAHDYEVKWLQNHPTVLYDNKLIEYAIDHVSNEFTKKGCHLLSEEALTEIGLSTSDPIYKVRLLSDSDILFYAKNIYPNSVINEFFIRKTRKKPLWKSESEYRALFEQSSVSTENLSIFEKKIEKLTKSFESNFPLVDDSTIEKLKNELLHVDNITNLDIKEGKKESLDFNIKFCESLKTYSEENGLKNEYVILSSQQFCSGFKKDDFKNIKIYFPHLGKTKKLTDVLSVFEVPKSRPQYLLFFIDPEDKKRISIHSFVDFLCDFIYKNCKNF